MFWGGIIKEGAPLKSQKLLETSEFSVLHLSAAVLAKTAGDKQPRTTLVAKNAKEPEVVLAALSAARDSASLDLYINCTQNVTLAVRGPAEIHLSGYFEPKGDDMDDDMFYGQEEGDDDEDDASDEADQGLTAANSKAKNNGEVKSAALNKNLSQAKLNSNKNAASAMLQPDSDESEDELADEIDSDDQEEAIAADDNDDSDDD